MNVNFDADRSILVLNPDPADGPEVIANDERLLKMICLVFATGGEIKLRCNQHPDKVMTHTATVTEKTITSGDLELLEFDWTPIMRKENLQQ